MTQCILTIDASKSEQTTIVLNVEDKQYEKHADSRQVQSQAVLPLITSLLAENSIMLSQLTAIEVHSGPGSFTGLRVGATIGNTLSWLLHIPINGKKPGSFVDLQYQPSAFD